MRKPDRVELAAVEHSRPSNTRGRRTLAAIASLLLAAAVLAVAAAPASAAKTISFDSTPTGWTVHEGEKDRSVGTVSASGINVKNLRYSLSGPSAFKIKARSGRVAYDGGTLPAGDSVTLIVTASHRKGKATPANMLIEVAVHRHVAELTADPAADDGGQPIRIGDRADVDGIRHRHYCVNPATTYSYKDEVRTLTVEGSNPPRTYMVTVRVRDTVKTNGFGGNAEFTYRGQTLTSTPYDGKPYTFYHTHSVSTPLEWHAEIRYGWKDGKRQLLNHGETLDEDDGRGVGAPSDMHSPGQCETRWGSGKRRAWIDRWKIQVDCKVEGATDNCYTGDRSPGKLPDYHDEKYRDEHT